LTVLEGLKSAALKLFWAAMFGIYYVGAIFWLFFPVLIIIVDPYVTGFLRNVGQQLRLHPDTLTGCAYMFAAIDVGFLIWHFLIRKYRTGVFKNKFFWWWKFLANFALIILLGAVIFQPVYHGRY
jgi:hypothetical protein